MSQYLITVTTDARWSQPDEIWCVSGLAELEANLKQCAEEHAEGDGITISTWELTPVEVVSVAFEVQNLPKLPKKAKR